MHIKYASINRPDPIEYNFAGETVIARMGDVEDTFDFSALGDGGRILVDTIETSLPVNPIVEAYRENGHVYVILLRHYQGGGDQRTLHLDWQEVS